jgi:uncharacterized membrane protein
MSEIALPRINSFASVAQQAEVSPEEPIFVLSSSQLHEIVFKAVQNALESQKSLHEIVQCQAKEIRALNARLEAIQKDMNSLAENQLNQLRLIADIRKVQEPQPLQKDRREILRALIAANGGKMLAKEARQKMHLSKTRFSLLLDTMASDIDSKPYHSDKRQLVLRLK